MDVLEQNCGARPRTLVFSPPVQLGPDVETHCSRRCIFVSVHLGHIDKPARATKVMVLLITVSAHAVQNWRMELNARRTGRGTGSATAQARGPAPTTRSVDPALLRWELGRDRSRTGAAGRSPTGLASEATPHPWVVSPVPAGLLAMRDLGLRGQPDRN